ncbi:MAG: hypothetical protein J6T57_01555 [Alphaproteobacteria bacterium]|nr:hypothetical protein [Alphaproteobacteria bacterium]
MSQNKKEIKYTIRLVTGDFKPEIEDVDELIEQVKEMICKFSAPVEVVRKITCYNIHGANSVKQKTPKTDKWMVYNNRLWRTVPFRQFSWFVRNYADKIDRARGKI